MTPHRFSGIELDAIEKAPPAYPDKLFFDRLEATLDDAMRSEMYTRIAQVERIFQRTLPQEYQNIQETIQ